MLRAYEICREADARRMEECFSIWGSGSGDLKLGYKMALTTWRVMGKKRSKARLSAVWKD